MQRKVCMPVWKPQGLSSSRGILLAEKICSRQNQCLSRSGGAKALAWRRVHSFCANFVTALLPAEKVERCVHENALIADAKFKSTFEPLECARKRLVISAVSTLVETDKPWAAEPHTHSASAQIEMRGAARAQILVHLHLFLVDYPNRWDSAQNAAPS